MGVFEHANSRRAEFAKWQPRCDCCGRFVIPGSPGSSWVHVPDSHVSTGDDRDRCAACTDSHGPAQAAPGYVEHLVQGTVPKDAQGRKKGER